MTEQEKALLEQCRDQMDSKQIYEHIQAGELKELPSQK